MSNKSLKLFIGLDHVKQENKLQIANNYIGGFAIYNIKDMRFPASFNWLYFGRIEIWLRHKIHQTLFLVLAA